MREYNYKFKPRERAFLILKKKIIELEEKTTKEWKVIYSLVVPKLGQEDPFMDMEAKYEEGKKEQEVRVEEIEKKIKEKVEEAPKAKQQPTEQVQEQSSPHSIPTEQVEIHDELEVEVQNQNPLTLKEIRAVMD